MDTATDSKAAASTDMISSGQIVAKMLKQDGIKHIFRGPGSAVN